MQSPVLTLLVHLGFWAGGGAVSVEHAWHHALNGRAVLRHVTARLGGPSLSAQAADPPDVEQVFFLGVPKVVWAILLDVIAFLLLLGGFPTILYLAKRRLPFERTAAKAKKEHDVEQR